MEINISAPIKNQILASIEAGTFYVPSQSSGANTSPEFFDAVANKTLEVKLLSVGPIAKGGRNSSNGFATNDDTFRAVCGVQVGNEKSEIRLHLCDILPCLESGKGTFTFKTFKPKDREETYLVPLNTARFTSAQIGEFMATEKTANLIVSM